MQVLGSCPTCGVGRSGGGTQKPEKTQPPNLGGSCDAAAVWEALFSIREASLGKQGIWTSQPPGVMANPWLSILVS